MTLTINTNIASIIAERNLNTATNNLNRSLERLSTGFTINHAADNAAGYSIADMWTTQISSLDIASDNASMGADLLTTAEQTYGLLTDHLQRIRDLTVQASNGTFGSTSLKSIQSEIHARLQEISRIAANAEYNGIKLMSYASDVKDTGIRADGINLQVGLYANDDSSINLSVDLFKNASVSGLFSGMSGITDMINAAKGNVTVSKLNTEEGYETFAAACAGLKVKYDSTSKTYDFELQSGTTAKDAKEMIGFVDKAIDGISKRVTQIGAAQNRVTSAISAIDVQSQNLTSSLSTLRDTDVASESSKYIQAQILQQASATLLATANQTPSIALNLL
jgi:flagellin